MRQSKTFSLFLYNPYSEPHAPIIAVIHYLYFLTAFLSAVHVHWLRRCRGAVLYGCLSQIAVLYLCLTVFRLWTYLGACRCELRFSLLCHCDRENKSANPRLWSRNLSSHQENIYITRLYITHILNHNIVNYYDRRMRSMCVGLNKIM
jgi:hypothetical protein